MASSDGAGTCQIVNGTSKLRQCEERQEMGILTRGFFGVQGGHGSREREVGSVGKGKATREADACLELGRVGLTVAGVVQVWTGR